MIVWIVPYLPPLEYVTCYYMGIPLFSIYEFSVN